MTTSAFHVIIVSSIFFFFFFGTSSSQLSEFQDAKANQALPLGPCGWQHGTFVLPECASVQHCLCMHVHASGASPCEENKIQQRNKKGHPSSSSSSTLLPLFPLSILHLSPTSQLSACLPAQRSRTDAVPIRLVI